MVWLVLIVLLVGIPLLASFYRGRLDMVRGPWIAGEWMRHD